MLVDAPGGQPHECTSTALVLQLFAGGRVAGSLKREPQNTSNKSDTSKIVALSDLIFIPEWDSCPGIPANINASHKTTQVTLDRWKDRLYR